MFSGSTDIGIDLGTANILVYVKGKGTVLNEPSVMAVEKKTNKILAVGSEAREMLGRTPHGIVAVRPLREGVIANYTITQKMLEYLIHKVAGKSFFFRPRVMTCIPVNITSVEKRAVLEATIQAGVSKTYLIEEPLAAALGAGLDIMVPSGKMVVDIGGGTTDIAILSLGGVVDSDSVRIGGDKFNEAIVRYVKKEYNCLIGETLAECGVGFDQVVKATVWLSDMQHFAGFNQVYQRHFSNGFPVRSTVSAGLALGVDVEIEVQAWVGTTD